MVTSMIKVFNSISFKFLILFIGVYVLSFSVFSIFTLEREYSIPYILLVFIVSFFIFKIKDVDKKKFLFGIVIALGASLGSYTALLFVSNIKAQSQANDIINATSFYSAMDLVMKKDCSLASSLLKQDLKIFLTTNPSSVLVISREEIWKKAAINGCISGDDFEQAKLVLNTSKFNK